jgi:hypothetical protein
MRGTGAPTFPFLFFASLFFLLLFLLIIAQYFNPIRYRSESKVNPSRFSCTLTR